MLLWYNELCDEMRGTRQQTIKAPLAFDCHNQCGVEMAEEGEFEICRL